MPPLSRVYHAAAAAAAQRLTPGGVWAWAWRRGDAARGAGLVVSLATRAGRARSHFATDTARHRGRGYSHLVPYRLAAAGG